MEKGRKHHFREDPTTTDALETELQELEALIGKVRRHQATIIALLDSRQVASGDGCRTMAEWLTSRLDIAATTSRDLLTITRTTHDDTDSDSFDRHVVTTRLRDHGAPKGLIDYSYGSDITGARRLLNNLSSHSVTEETEVGERAYMVLQRTLDGLGAKLHGELVGTDVTTVENTLINRADSFPAEPDGMIRPRAARMADALVSVCLDATNTTNHPDSGSDDELSHSDHSYHGGVVIHVDARQHVASAADSPISVLEAGPRVGVNAISEILCTSGTSEVVAWTGDCTPLSYGRSSRMVPPKLRKAVLHRDGHACTVDGCQSRYRLQSHHIQPYWERTPDGIYGPTDPENLTTLCWYHHHVVVHRQGRQLDPTSPPRRRRFLPRNTSGTDPPN